LLIEIGFFDFGFEESVIENSFFNENGEINEEDPTIKHGAMLCLAIQSSEIEDDEDPHHLISNNEFKGNEGLWGFLYIEKATTHDSVTATDGWTTKFHLKITNSFFENNKNLDFLVAVEGEHLYISSNTNEVKSNTANGEDGIVCNID
jgi:hypothetical protein